MAQQQQLPQESSIVAQPQQTTAQYQTGIGQQPQVGQQQIGAPEGIGVVQQPAYASYDASFDPQVKTALEDLKQLHNVAEWGKSRCNEMGQQFVEAARICDDVAELAELTETFLARKSVYSSSLANTFVTVADQAAQYLSGYQAAEIQELVGAIDRTVQSTQNAFPAIEAIARRPAAQFAQPATQAQSVQQFPVTRGFQQPTAQEPQQQVAQEPQQPIAQQ